MPLLDDYLLDPAQDVTVTLPDGDYTLGANYYNSPITVARAATSGAKRGHRILKATTKHGVKVKLDWPRGLGFSSASDARLIFQGLQFLNGNILLEQPGISFWHCDLQHDRGFWSSHGNFVTVTVVGTTGNTFVDVVSGSAPSGGWVGKYLQCAGYSLGTSNRKAPTISSTSVVGGRTRLQLASTATYSGIPNNQVQSGGSNKTAQVGSDPKVNNYPDTKILITRGGNAKRINVWGSDLHNCGDCAVVQESEDFSFFGARLYDSNEPPFDPTDASHNDAIFCQKTSGGGTSGAKNHKIEDSYIHGRCLYNDTGDSTGVSVTRRTEPKWRNVWHNQGGVAGFQLRAYGNSSSTDRGVIGYTEDVLTWNYGSGAARIDGQRNDDGSFSTDSTAPWNSLARVQVDSESWQALGNTTADGPKDGNELNDPANPALVWRARWDWLDLEEFMGWGTSVGAPSTPVNVTLAQGPNAGELIVTWEPPTSDGGRPITSYEVSLGVNPATTGAGGPTSKTASSRSHTYTGLTAATTYKAQVKALNDQGPSTAGLSGTANPPAGGGGPTKPGVPTSVVLVPGNGVLTLRWEVPAAGPTVPTGYVTRIIPPSTQTSKNSTDRQHLYENLINGQSYIVEIWSVNAQGASDVVTRVAAPIEPAAPVEIALATELEAMEWTKTSHLAVFRTEIYKRETGRELLVASSYGTPRVYVQDGSVRAQRQSLVSRSFTATIIGEPGDIVPQPEVHLLDPLYRPLIRMHRGVKYFSDISHRYLDYYWPLGTFVINRCNISSSEKGVVSVEIGGDDRSVLISANKWDVPYNIENSPTYDQAIMDLIVDRTNGIFTPIFNFETSDNACPDMTFDTSDDPWEQAQKMAEADGKELFIDADDTIVLRTIPSNEGDSVFWTFRDKPGDPMLPGGEREIDIQEAYNGVVMRGSAPWLLFEVVGTAWDEDPNSPTYYLGPFGKKPKELDDAMVGTAAQATDAARKQLPNYLGIAEEVSFQGIVNPAIKPGHTVKISSTRLGIDDRGIVEDVEIPITVKAGMSLTTRRQRRG